MHLCPPPPPQGPSAGPLGGGGARHARGRSLCRITPPPLPCPSVQSPSAQGPVRGGGGGGHRGFGRWFRKARGLCPTRLRPRALICNAPSEPRAPSERVLPSMHRHYAAIRMAIVEGAANRLRQSRACAARRGGGGEGMRARRAAAARSSSRGAWGWSAARSRGDVHTAVTRPWPS